MYSDMATYMRGVYQGGREEGGREGGRSILRLMVELGISYLFKTIIQ